MEPKSTSERVNLGGKIELVTIGYNMTVYAGKWIAWWGLRLLLVEINAIDGLKLPSYLEIYTN